MSDKLREILTEFFNEGYQEALQGIKHKYLIDKTIKQIQDEEKKWALGLLPKESKTTNSEFDWGYDECIAEIRKRIEESK